VPPAAAHTPASSASLPSRLLLLLLRLRLLSALTGLSSLSTPPQLRLVTLHWTSLAWSLPLPLPLLPLLMLLLVLRLLLLLLSGKACGDAGGCGGERLSNSARKLTRRSIATRNCRFKSAW
jgi:hypothetical protein